MMPVGKPVGKKSKPTVRLTVRNRKYAEKNFGVSPVLKLCKNNLSTVNFSESACQVQAIFKRKMLHRLDMSPVIYTSFV